MKKLKQREREIVGPPLDCESELDPIDGVGKAIDAEWMWRLEAFEPVGSNCNKGGVE